MFRNNKHEIHTVKLNKVALNRNDDKRIVKKDGIITLASCPKSLGWTLLSGSICKLEACNSFVTKLNESHNLSDTPFS